MKLRPFLYIGVLSLATLPSLAMAAKDDPQADALTRRLAALQNDPQTSDLARYERLQAQQTVAALAEAKRRDRDELVFLADRRVEIAELTARTALARRELDRLEGTRNDLLIEASRRDASRARQEAERLRVQAQIQAEEAERMRQAAEQETLARQDAELALTSVAGKQTAKLNAAQQRPCSSPTKRPNWWPGPSCRRPRSMAAAKCSRSAATPLPARRPWPVPVPARPRRWPSTCRSARRAGSPSSATTATRPRPRSVPKRFAMPWSPVALPPRACRSVAPRAPPASRVRLRSLCCRSPSG